MVLQSYQRIRFLLQTNYGRNAGWHMILNDEIVAELVEPVSVEMFWDEYRVTYSKEFAYLVRNTQNWQECRFEYQNRGIGENAKNAFCGGGYREFCAGKSETVSMRGLYLVPANVTERMFEKILFPVFARVGVKIVGRIF